MKRSIFLSIFLSILAFGCGDDDPANANNTNNTNNVNNEVAPPIALPAVASLSSGTGGATSDAYLCEMATEGGGFEFTLEPGANASPCEGGLVYINFQYDTAEQVYEARAGRTLATGEEADVSFTSASMGNINERETNEPARLEGIPVDTDTTLTTDDWSITFRISEENVAISGFEAAGS